MRINQCSDMIDLMTKQVTMEVQRLDQSFERNFNLSIPGVCEGDPVCYWKSASHKYLFRHFALFTLAGVDYAPPQATFALKCTCGQRDCEKLSQALAQVPLADNIRIPITAVILYWSCV